jgi:hypothetical protein
MASANKFGFLPQELKKISSNDISASSPLGRTIMANARSLANQNNQVSTDFLSAYSIKFQGCHHVSQWNADAHDEGDVRIRTKRLVRFRLCPSESCSNDKSSGCTSKYGDYVVDLNTFVYAYLSAIANEKSDICDETTYECKQSCNGGKDNDCMTACYDGFGVSYCVNGDNDDNNGFDVAGYGVCTQFKMNARRLADAAYSYYLGPYCAEQGGEIHLGLFTDDTCTTFASNGESTFQSAMGFSLPYSDTSLVSNRCLACAHKDEYGNVDVKNVCQTAYAVSGKCETKMTMDYPNESACTYVEGIKIIRADGVIRTSAVKKSKSAAVCIGLFLTIAVLLAGYVYYLRTSKYNLGVSPSCSVLKTYLTTTLLLVSFRAWASKG